MPALKNKKHERFCREYVIDHNGTQAAIRAGYSEKTANEQAARLLTNVSIRARVDELDGDVFDKLGVTHEKVAREYEKLAFTTSDELFEYVDERVLVQEETCDTPAIYKTFRKAYLKPHTELTKDQLSTIQEIRETTTGIAIKQYSRKDALDSIAKFKGMDINKHEVTGKDGGAIVTIIRDDDAKL